MPEEKRMGFVEHLEEVRSRLMISIIAILVTTAIAYVFADTIIQILMVPAGETKLIALSPMDGFIIHFRVALYGGVVLAAPVWIFQVLRFIEPGLLPNEKRLLIPGVVAAVVLFVMGNVFGYLMLSNMFAVLKQLFGSTITYWPGADPYISFVVYFLVAIGISFEMPIVILVLIKMGIVSPQFLRKQRRIAYFVLFVFAELITPVSDPIVAPMVVMVPMVVLFELALLASRFVAPKPKTVQSPAATGSK